MSLLAPDSEVDMCNVALSHLKQAPIRQIDPPTTSVEEKCAMQYHQVRQETLRCHPWNFATKRVQLTPDSGATPLFGFTHAYLLPNDFIRFLGRYDDLGNRITGVEQGVDYELEGRYLLVNGEDGGSINIRYTSDFQTVIKMDPLFRKLFALNFAITLAPNFSSSESRVNTLMALQKDAKAEATAIDGQERPPRRTQRSKFIAARRGFGRGGEASPYTNFSG